MDEATRLGVLLERIPLGWSRVRYDGRDWGVTRGRSAGGRSEHVYAEELAGTGVVSANVYRLADGPVLKPCEMPAATVLAFLREAEQVD